jgi:hypothetical protein
MIINIYGGIDMKDYDFKLKIGISFIAIICLTIIYELL